MDIRIEYGQRDDYVNWQEMFIDGDSVLFVKDLWETPEDACLGRDLVSPSQVVYFMKKAFGAGRRGEEFTVEEVEDV
jgi:hypothetical protein